MQYIMNIAIALAVGGLSSILTSHGVQNFEANFVQSPLTPPSSVFPLVWTILYILMAIGYTKATEDKNPKAVLYYWLQLAFNFFWSIWFFNANAFLFSFIWLIILLILVVLMTISFGMKSKVAAWLQIPYILWLLFAGYLNYMVYLLN